MNDVYTEEIHKIRECIYEETKNMSSEELDRYYSSASEQFEKQVAECRAKKGVETRTAAAAVR